MGECSICLEGTCPPLLKLYCGHSFHKHCISRWFKTHNTCPVCRQLIVNKFIATNKKLNPLKKTTFYVISIFQYTIMIKEYLKKPVSFTYRELVNVKPKKDSIELNFLAGDKKFNYNFKLEMPSYIRIISSTIKQNIENMLTERVLW